MESVISASAKLLLFGEHAAVSGHPAIGLPLPWRMHIRSAPAETADWEIAPPLAERQRRQMQQVLDGLAMPPKKLFITTDIPIGVGFGSSGALCTALAKLHFHPATDQQKTWETAHRLEKVFHTTPSGIDTGIAVFERLCYFKRGKGALPDVKQLDCPELFLIIGALPRASTTAALVSAVQNHPEKERCFARLGEIAESAAALLESGAQERTIGEMATEAHLLLKTLDLSTPAMDTLLKAGVDMGALGGKLSGAGGGGAFYLLADSAKEAETLAEALNLYCRNEGIHLSHPLMPFTHPSSNFKA